MSLLIYVYFFLSILLLLQNILYLLMEPKTCSLPLKWLLFRLHPVLDNQVLLESCVLWGNLFGNCEYIPVCLSINHTFVLLPIVCVFQWGQLVSKHTTWKELAYLCVVCGRLSGVLASFPWTRPPTPGRCTGRTFWPARRWWGLHVRWLLRLTGSQSSSSADSVK